MAALALDTHALVKELRAAGFDDRQAEAVTRVVTTTKEAFDLATKQDLREAEAALKRDLRELELRLEAKITTAVEGAKAEIIKWMFGVVGVQTLVILGFVLTLLRPWR